MLGVRLNITTTLYTSIYLFTNTNRPNSTNNIRALVYFKCRALINWFAIKMLVKSMTSEKAFKIQVHVSTDL